MVDIGINRHRLDGNDDDDDDDDDNKEKEKEKEEEEETPTSFSKDWDAKALVRKENRDWASFPHNNYGQNFSFSAYHVSPPYMLWMFKG